MVIIKIDRLPEPSEVYHFPGDAVTRSRNWRVLQGRQIGIWVDCGIENASGFDEFDGLLIVQKSPTTLMTNMIDFHKINHFCSTQCAGVSPQKFAGMAFVAGYALSLRICSCVRTGRMSRLL